MLHSSVTSFYYLVHLFLHKRFDYTQLTYSTCIHPPLVAKVTPSAKKKKEKVKGVLSFGYVIVRIWIGLVA